jgi:hypothetical protein
MDNPEMVFEFKPNPYFRMRNTSPIQRKDRKIGRNELCPCGSGEKYKNCCQKNQKKVVLKAEV